MKQAYALQVSPFISPKPHNALPSAIVLDLCAKVVIHSVMSFPVSKF